jgi:hypothetical protein
LGHRIAFDREDVSGLLVTTRFRFAPEADGTG